MICTLWKWVVLVALFSVLFPSAVLADSLNSSKEGKLFLKEDILPLPEKFSRTTRKFQEMFEKFKEYQHSEDSPHYTLQIVPPRHEFDRDAVVRPDDSVHYHMIIVNPETRKHVQKFFPRFPKHTPR